MQYQQVMCVFFVLLGYDLVEFSLDFEYVFSGSKSGPVCDAENMRVDCDRRMTESGIQYDVRGFSADAGKRFQVGAAFGNLAVVLVQDQPAQFDDVRGLTVE